TLFACKVHTPVRPCEGAITLGACVEPTPSPAACARGRARSLDEGTCISTRDTRELARAVGVFVADEDVIECEAEADELVASPRLGRIGCLAREAPRRPCPVGAVREGASCVSLVSAGTVDLGRWARAAAGEACERLARTSVALLSAPEAEIEIEL